MSLNNFNGRMVLNSTKFNSKFMKKLFIQKQLGLKKAKEISKYKAEIKLI